MCETKSHDQLSLPPTLSLDACNVAMVTTTLIYIRSLTLGACDIAVVTPMPKIIYIRSLTLVYEMLWLHIHLQF